MFREVEVTPEDEDKLIRKAAEIIHRYGMEAAAILFIESVKPLAYVGGQMGRLFVSPFLPILGESADIGGEKFFTVFEKRENVEKLLKLLEEKAKEEPKKKEAEKPGEAKNEGEEGAGEASGVVKKKKGWRRILPTI